MVADLTRLAESVREVEEAGADVMHLDVMDGHFVPSIQAGTTMVSAVSSCATRPVDAHLMMDNPEKHVEDFAEAGADIILFHVEVTPDPGPLLKRIRDLGCECGLAIKPDTPPEAVEPVADLVDSLLVMSVEPGYSGQEFMRSACDKIPELRRMCGPDVDIGVDGGINTSTAKTVIGLGANLLVAGSAIFRADVPPADALRRLRQAAEQALASRSDDA